MSYNVDPPAITAIEITEVCTNDFTVSWTAASNQEGLSYGVTLFPSGMTGDITINSMMNTSYNFTDLMPNTAYNVSVASVLARTCVGIVTTTVITTLTIEAGLPQSELLYSTKFWRRKTLANLAKRTSFANILPRFTKVCMYVANVSYFKFTNIFLTKTLKQSICQSFTLPLYGNCCEYSNL